MASALQDLLSDPRSRAARDQPVPRRQPAGRLAARLRRPGHRPGAGRRHPHRRRARPPHSLHAYFMRPGDPAVPIIYEVDRIRDGRASPPAASSRSSMAKRSSPCRPRSRSPSTGFEHQVADAEVPPPEELPSEARDPQGAIPDDACPRPMRRYLRARAADRAAPGRARHYRRAASRRRRRCRCLDPGHRPAARRSRRSTNACSPMPPT